MIHLDESLPAVGAPPQSAPPSRAARATAWLTAILMAGVSAAGVVLPGLYEETDAVTAAFRGYDVVTLLVAVPLLVVTLGRAPSPMLLLVRAGVLGFAVYQYAYYVFGMAFNSAFLAHLATFTTATVALGMTVRCLYPSALAWPEGKARTASFVLGLLGISLGALWISRSLTFAFGGPVPADGSLLVGTPALTHLGYAMDLAVLVPAYAAAAIGVWRRRPWAYVAAGVTLVAGTLSQLTYMSALVLQRVIDIPGATGFDPYEPFIVAVYVVGITSLYRAIRPVRPLP